MRTDLCAEAIRLGRLVRELMGPQPPAEATGLLALMLLHDSRRDARLDDAGDIVVLEEQDRTRWHQTQIAEALPLVEQAFRDGPGPFSCAGGDCGSALPGGATAGYRLAADPAALRCSGPDDAFPGGLAEPRGSRGHGGRPRSGADPDRRAWPQGATCRTTTCCIPRARICCVGRAHSRRRRKPTRRRSALVNNQTERRYLERRLREVS